MTNKIALITGANRGIGFETARQLGKLGCTILLGSRDAHRGEAAVKKLREEEIDAHVVVIDPTQPSSVQNAVKEVEGKFQRLDILVNNAGVFLQEDQLPPSQVLTKTFRDTYETNVFGLHEVTSAFWPLLNKSSGARLVNVSSGLGSMELHANGSFGDFKVIAYDSSKAAVNMMTIHYASQWKDSPHRANAIHPGSVKTDMNQNGELSVEDGAKTSVRLATIGSEGPNGGFFHMDDTLPW